MWEDVWEDFFPLNLFVIVSFHIQIIKGSEPSNVIASEIHMEPAELVCVGGRVNFSFSFFFAVREEIMWQSCVTGQQ